MTKKLESLFNLPEPSEEPIEETVEPETALQSVSENQQIFRDIDLAIDKIDEALPAVRDLDASDTEMDELADLAKDKFNDLMDLGMSMEARHSALVFQTASQLLGHAITAKTAKMDKKLRMIDLQLKKMRLDHQIKKDNGIDDAIPQESTLMDRNDLLKQLLGKKDGN
jgi:hypothetical protein